MRHESSDQLRRLAGLIGLAGAVLLFVGDMGFTGISDPARGLRTVCLRLWYECRQSVFLPEA
jgi:hypothetical protein